MGTLPGCVILSHGTLLSIIFSPHTKNEWTEPEELQFAPGTPCAIFIQFFAILFLLSIIAGFK